MEFPVGVLIALALWGTWVGLDLVSLPQMMASRPLVAGTVAGVIVGDLVFGVAAGAVLELFALETLAIGAARYPDYGAATVGAVVAGSGGPPEQTLGVAVVLGLVLASVGGWSLVRLRQANATAVRFRAASLGTGDPVAVRAVHFSGLARDLFRSALLSAIALSTGLVLRGMPALPDVGQRALLVLVVGGGVAGALSGAIRSGRGTRLGWLGTGVACGLLLVALTA